MLTVLAGQLGVLGSATRRAGFNPASFADYYLEVRPGPSHLFTDAACLIPAIDGSTIRGARDPFTNAIIATQTGLIGLCPTMILYEGKWTLWCTGGQHLNIPNVTLPTAGTVAFGARRVGPFAFEDRWSPVQTESGTWLRFSGLGFQGVMRNTRLEAVAATPDCQTQARQYSFRSSSSTWQALADGAVYLTAAANHRTTAATWRLGGFVENNGGQHHDGPIYGLLVYSSYLSDADLLTVEDYQRTQFT